jgi:hypothetical protein
MDYWWVLLALAVWLLYFSKLWQTRKPQTPKKAFEDAYSEKANRVAC